MEIVTVAITAFFYKHIHFIMSDYTYDVISYICLAGYESWETPCNNVFTVGTSVFVPPSGFYYGGYGSCNYIIRRPAGETIILTWEQLEMGVDDSIMVSIAVVKILLK